MTHWQILVDQQIFVEFGVLQFDIIHVAVHHGVQGNNGVKEIAGTLFCFRGGA